jgi:hypothetical protein
MTEQPTGGFKVSRGCATQSDLLPLLDVHIHRKLLWRRGLESRSVSLAEIMSDRISVLTTNYPGGRKQHAALLSRYDAKSPERQPSVGHVTSRRSITALLQVGSFGTIPLQCECSEITWPSHHAEDRERVSYPNVS